MSNIIFYDAPVYRDGELVKVREMYKFYTGKKIKTGDVLIDEVYEGMVDDDIKIQHKKAYAKYLEIKNAPLTGDAIDENLPKDSDADKAPAVDVVIDADEAEITE